MKENIASEKLRIVDIIRENATAEITLREHLETMLVERDKRYEQKFNDTKIAVDAALIAADKAVAAALAGQKEAVTKAEVAAEKRFESVNEFRSTLSDQQRNLMPRVEVEIMMKSVAEKIDGLSKLLDSRADANEKRIITLESAGKGVGVGMGYIIGIVGVVSIVASIIMGFIK
jgi:hypothetical protein